MMKNTAICVQSHEMRISPGPRNGHPVAVTFGQSNFKHSIGPLRQASGYVPNALIRFSHSAEEGMLHLPVSIPSVRPTIPRSQGSLPEQNGPFIEGHTGPTQVVEFGGPPEEQGPVTG